MGRIELRRCQSVQLPLFARIAKRGRESAFRRAISRCRNASPPTSPKFARKLSAHVLRLPHLIAHVHVMSVQSMSVGSATPL